MLGIFMPYNDNEDLVVKHYEEPLYKTIGEDVGGFIEIVRVKLGDRKNVVIVVNDEGVLQGLPLNDVASMLYGSPIFGNAVLMYEGFNEDGEPDIIGIKEEDVLPLLLDMFAIAINSEEIEND